MKRLLLFTTMLLACLFSLGTLQAQVGTPVLLSKKGEPFLPAAGDFALGVDASPALYYLGNMFNNSTEIEFPGFVPPNSLFALQGRYFKDAQTAYRGIARIGLMRDTETEWVSDINNTNEEVKNRTATSSTTIVLGAGLEKRRGTGRIQGYYGAEGRIGFGGGQTRFTYGNSLSDVGFGSRTVSDKNGSFFLLGVRGLVGAEVFIFPKASLGVEFGLGLALQQRGRGSVTREFLDNSTVMQETTTEGAATTTFGLDTDNNGGTLLLNFFF